MYSIDNLWNQRFDETFHTHFVEDVRMSSVVEFIGSFGVKHSNIMYYGAKYCINSEATIPVFKFAGVLQWAVLYGFAACF